MSSIDVLDYMLPPLSFTRTSHLVSGEQGGNPSFGLWQPNWIWEIKGEKGFPWDVNFYDEQYVYQCVTEGPNGWSDATSYKAFASKSWPNGQGGIAWSPRYFDPSQGNPAPLVTEDSTFNTYQSGKLVATQNLGGPIVTTLDGPRAVTIGSLGSLQCLIQRYLWGAGLANMEVNYYALGYGHVQWELWVLANGVYTRSKHNLTDQVAQGGTPPVNFPNALP